MALFPYLLLALVATAAAAPGSRIGGGTETSIEEFPYIVAVVYTYPQGPTIQRCVGCLVSSWHVLTSGFCYTGANIENMVIRAGSTNSLSGGTVVLVNRFVKHEDYEEAPRAGDIAVTFTQTPLALSNVIGVLFLPAQGGFIPDGQEVKVVSWGFEYLGGPQLERLKTILLNKISLADCMEEFADNDGVVISDAVICAKAPGRGMCVGDSGAPMVINDVVVGISSYYKECGSPDADVFTRIDRYTNWVLDVAAAPTNAVDAVGIRSKPISL